MNRLLFPVLIAGLLFPAALVGCGTSPPAQPIVGAWTGHMTTGNLTLPARWELQDDGTQSVSLTIPQGLLTTQGTFTFHDGTLTQRTTSRAIILNGQKKTMPLVNPMETTYQCQLTGDTLTLNRPDMHEKITLTRTKHDPPINTTQTLPELSPQPFPNTRLRGKNRNSAASG